MENLLERLNPKFKKFLKIASKIAKSMDFKIYLVGGVVRDLILKREVFDLDILVEGDAISLANKISEYLRKEFKKHQKFGTATIYFENYKIDFATARREVYSYWGALPKVEPASLKEDIARRDFTINSMAISLNKKDYGSLLDFYNGLFDLKKKLIRVLHKESFLEDPTRILRAIRFEKRFSFKIEKNTFLLMKEAIKLGALNFVHPHRLRDELFLILNEPKPYIYIKRMNELKTFYFINNKLEPSLELIFKIKKALDFYKFNFKKYRKLDDYIVYLCGIIFSLSLREINNFSEKFGLRKKEYIIITSVKKSFSKIKKLNKKLKPHQIYKIIDHLSFESIIFFYAYYSNKMIKKNIEHFLKKIVRVRLFLKGEDFKRLGIRPFSLYNKIMEKLLYWKMDNNLKDKDIEEKKALEIFKSVSKKLNKRIAN